MKKTLVLAILGIAVSGPVFGQGVVQFNNYQSTTYQQVKYDNDSSFGAQAGKPVTSPTVKLQLFWALGTLGSQSAFNTAANAGLTTFINPGFTYNGGGYYGGGNQLLTGWTSGQAVTFQVLGWETAGPAGGLTFSQSSITGTSALWTEVAASDANHNGIQPSSNPAKFFNNGPPGMILVIGPEPSTFALASLSAAALMLYRRKKKV